MSFLSCCLGRSRSSKYERKPSRGDNDFAQTDEPELERKKSVAEKFLEERERNDSIDSQGTVAGRSNSFDIMRHSNVTERVSLVSRERDSRASLRDSRAPTPLHVSVTTRDSRASNPGTVSVLSASSGTTDNSDGNSPTSDSFETNYFQQELERDYKMLRGSCPPSMGANLVDEVRSLSSVSAGPSSQVENRDDRVVVRGITGASSDVGGVGGSGGSSMPPTIKTRGDGVQETTELKINHDEVGYKHLNQYIIIKSLGKGTFGKVKLVLNTLDNQLYAIKVVNKRLLANKIRGKGKLAKVQGSAQMIAKEVAIMKKLDHPNTVNLHEVIEDPNSHKIYLILEFVAGGPIKEKRDRTPIPESVCRLYIRDILKGLSYLHFNKIVHRDLKPENLLKHADGSIKIADFGVANFFEHDNEVNSTAGTPAFIAPEVISKIPHDPTASDVWSLGVCLYNMIYGVLPFTGSSVMEVYGKICEAELKFPENPETSDDVRQLLEQLLVKDPVKRLTVKQFCMHPWVTLDDELPLVLHDDKLLQVQITHNEILSAITSNSLVSIFSPALTQKVYEPGEYLMRQGEQGSDMFFIDSGEVEILICESESKDNSFTGSYEDNTFEAMNSRGTNNSAASLRSGMSCPGSVASSDSGSGSGGSGDHSVIAVRGAGQFIGEMALFQSGVGHKRTASVRAKTSVTALVVTKAQADEIIHNEPLVRERIASEILKRTNETTVFKTRRRLSGEASGEHSSSGTPRKSKVRIDEDKKDFSATLPVCHDRDSTLPEETTTDQIIAESEMISTTADVAERDD